MGHVVRLLARQVALTPEAVAVEFGAEQLTYRELDDAATEVAAGLRAHGVAREILVGLAFERSTELIIGLLGVLKAGGAYLPLDASYPETRLSFMLEDSAVRLVLTGGPAEHGPKLPLAANAQVLRIDELRTGPLPDVRRGDDDLAYVLYTSGSTGTPKGVAMAHRPLANLIGWHIRQEGSLEGTRTAQFAPVSFDVSFQEIFSTLCAGGTLVLVPDDVRRNSERLLEFLVTDQITRLFLPTPALAVLAERARQAPPLRALRRVICAGDQLQITPAVRAWFRSTPDCTLHNHYGPSESHVVTAYTLRQPVHDWPSLPPIGRPLPHVQAYILDQFLHPVPDGERGELYLGGPCLARGYLGRPDLTDERFLPNPFGAGRLYRTGDIVFRRPQHNDIEYAGRADHQVKIRGFRVELGEVEAVLAQHPDVAQCAVDARPDITGQKRLVAYVVPRVPGPIAGALSLAGNDAEPGAAPPESEWRAYLQEHLPDFMIPSAVVTLPHLPLTPSGKVDRQALPAADRRHPRRRSALPLNASEAKLAALWCESLQLDAVGTDDNFFDLGGTSLLLTHVHHRITQQFGVDLPLVALFENPTIGTLVAALEAAAAGRSPEPGRTASRRARRGVGGGDQRGRRQEPRRASGRGRP